MPADQTSRDVSAKEAVSVIRSPMTNAEVMKLFKISAAGYADLLKQLYELKLITDEDLARRGIRVKGRKQPEPMKPVMLAPPPDEEDGEFVDTVTLTEMLSFKTFGDANDKK